MLEDKNIKQFPVTYKANKSAWMTSQFFEEVRKWDAELKGWKILLLVDNNCSAHPFITNLRTIELAFFPANTISILQPMDQSVIKSLKGHCRRKLLMELIETDGKTSINILHAVNFISKAWKEIKQFSIQPNHYCEDLQTYKNIDQDLATTASLTDEDIIDSVSKSKEEPNEDNEGDPVDDSEPSPTVQQALDAAKLIEKFLLFHENDSTTSQDMHKILKKIQNKYWHSKKRQAKLTEYMCLE
ncbi:tigger transposable element-derived protein 4-like [Anoplophora glabripennis]|uniref:tigger transposable element-derived protein 4-like n=1 Tax=Anoplophora glabripennis TaxID=217634 RepID=UPI0008750E45|nr:tigger transposable element-derived protein 4-like [Anoplophora glabripennis]